MQGIAILKDAKGGAIADALVGPPVVIFHLPELELVFALLRAGKAQRRKEFLLISTVAALNETIAPRLAFLDEGVNAATGFNGFGKGGFTFGMSRILHGKTHGIVGEGDEKGGSWSKERAKTAAMVVLS